MIQTIDDRDKILLDLFLGDRKKKLDDKKPDKKIVYRGCKGCEHVKRTNRSCTPSDVISTHSEHKRTKSHRSDKCCIQIRQKCIWK